MNTWLSIIAAICLAIILAFLIGILFGGIGAWLRWHLLDMPRFRRDYLIEMKRKYPQDYADKHWPWRWPDRLYDRVQRCRNAR